MKGGKRKRKKADFEIDDLYLKGFCDDKSFKLEHNVLPLWNTNVLNENSKEECIKNNKVDFVIGNEDDDDEMKEFERVNKIKEKQRKVEEMDKYKIEEAILNFIKENESETKSSSITKNKNKRIIKKRKDSFPDEQSDLEYNENKENEENEEIEDDFSYCSNNSKNFYSEEIKTYLEKKRNRDNNKQQLKQMSPSKEDINEDLNSFGSPRKKLTKLKKVVNNKELKLSLNTQCSICLENIVNLANPNNCQHDFCQECLFKWSQNCSTTCPLCKKPFQKILTYDKNKIIETKVEHKRQKIQNFEEPRNECYVCDKTTRKKDMIKCTNCNFNVCHYYCDGLDEMPDPSEKWLCYDCFMEKKEQIKMVKKVGKKFMG